MIQHEGRHRPQQVYQGLSNNVQLGAAYYIPTFVVPALVVTHVMIFRMLLRRSG